MKRSELKELAEKHCLLDCDIENAIEFVNELLELQADKIEKEEPYATNTIDGLRRSAYDVFGLLSDIEE